MAARGRGLDARRSGGVLLRTMHVPKWRIPPAAKPEAGQKLLDAIVVMAETHELRDQASALWGAAEDARDSARALAAESAQARLRSAHLRSEARAIRDDRQFPSS